MTDEQRKTADEARRSIEREARGRATIPELCRCKRGAVCYAANELTGVRTPLCGRCFGLLAAGQLRL